MTDSIFVNFGEIFKEADITRRVRAGEAVFQEGEPGDCMYVILAGEAEIRVKGKYADTIGVGGIIGEMALLDNSPRSATVVALEDCKLVGVTQEQFLHLIQGTPAFAVKIMRVMADRLRGMNMLLQ